MRKLFGVNDTTGESNRPSLLRPGNLIRDWADLAGYAVECGLNACVLAFVERTGVIFQDRKFLEKCWTHDLKTLIKAADLEVTRGLDISANSNMGANWLIVKDWSELARYQQFNERMARNLYEAVTDTANGVLPWEKTNW